MNKLKDYRKKIDLIDKKIVKLLVMRLKLIKKVGAHKKKNKIEMTDKKREMHVLNNIKKSGRLHQKFVVNIFKNIISYSKKIQK